MRTPLTPSDGGRDRNARREDHISRSPTALEAVPVCHDNYRLSLLFLPCHSCIIFLLRLWLTDRCGRAHTGQGLAMLEMTLTLATLFRRYDLQLDDGFELEYLPSFTLKPKNGLPVKVTRRQS